jgi:hypothetical protein
MNNEGIITYIADTLRPKLINSRANIVGRTKIHAPKKRVLIRISKSTRFKLKSFF